MTDIPVLQEERVPVKSRVWISIADSSTAILQSLVAASALTYYFVKLRGLDPKMAGVVWLLFGIWNAINDPLLGYISDRTRSKIGRRLPYIRFGAPLLALFFILFWIYLPGSDTNQTMLFLQMLVVLFLYDTIYTSIATNIYIMPYEMAVSNKARSSIYIWKIIFMVFTIIIPLGTGAFQTRCWRCGRDNFLQMVDGWFWIGNGSPGFLQYLFLPGKAFHPGGKAASILYRSQRML